MATQYIKFKRSAIPGKRPSNSQMELGELALNTNDGRLFTKKENVGIGTTVTLLNIWTENVGGGAYYTDGNIGIGITNPTSVLEVYTNDGDIKLGDITALSTTDVGISFSGLGTYTSAIFTELDGQILSYGINTPQIQNPRNTGRVGGIFRLDTRLPGGLGDSSCFVIKYAPVGFATTAGGPANGIRNGLIVSLQDGKTYLVPDEGNVLVGLKTDTGTLNQKLQVLGGAYINDSVGIGITNPLGLFQVGSASTQSVVVNEFGRVGIGTTNPSTRLDLIGVARMGGNDNLDVYTLTYADPSAVDVISIETINRANTIKKNLALNAYGGNVLIGSAALTGTNSQRLQVTGGAYVSGSVGIGTTNPIQQVQVGGIGTNTGLVISGFGSIGITTNNPVTYIDISSNTPTRNTVQFGSFGIQSFDNVNGFLSNNGYWDGEKWIYRRNGHSSLLQFLQGNIWLRTLPVGTAGSSGNIDTRIAVQNNGNIGINTNNPLLQLQIGPFNSSSIVGVTSVGLVGIGTTNPTSRLHISGDSLVTGVVTATAFNGNINAGIGTITNLSGTNVSYSGVGTIGTLDVNSADIDNLNTINISNSGIITTSNLVVNNEFDVYAPDSTFHDNVVIQGNLTVNGTQVILNVDDKFIKDKQIVLGFSTTNDVDDTTANGGGFGIASTEGSPLVCLQCTGINTLPSTYKQLIWTKANTFGAGTTDAFLFNYAVGIGSTLVPNGVRLSVGGVKITDSDVNATTFTGSGANLTSLNASNISSGTLDNARLPQNISVSGVITATTFSGNLQNTLTLNTSGTGLSGSATFNNSSSSTFTVTSNATSNNTGGTIVARNANGGFSAGIVTATFVGNVTGNLNSSGVNTAATLSGTTLTYTTGSITNVSGTNLNYTGISTITNVRSTTINNTGVGTITTLNSTTGTITNLSGTNVSYSGIGTVGSLNIGSTQVISSARQLQNIASLDATTTATIETAIANAPNTFTDLQVTGVSTFTNGPVLIGSGTSTGVSEQRLQVTGGGYISGSLGIGTTAPRDQGTLEVVSTIPGGGIRVSSFGTNSPGFRLVNNETGENAQNLLALSTGAGLINSRPGDYIIRNNAGGSIIFGLNQLGISTTGFVRITPNSELLVGSSSSITTGTLGQNLQVTGGAYVSGNLGIGTTNPTSKLTVQGDVLVSGVITSTDYNSASDINLKENIQPIENPIDKVLNITGVSFDWKEDGRSSMGVIAQEVERVLPELVSGSDSKTVNYNGLIGLLIEVVKEQQREINTLKEKIK
jgi:hypothetical protein